MEEVIEKLMEQLKKATAGYGYSDQWQIYEELSRRIAETGEEALRQEYMIEDMEGGEE